MFLLRVKGVDSLAQKVTRPAANFSSQKFPEMKHFLRFSHIWRSVDAW